MTANQVTTNQKRCSSTGGSCTGSKLTDLESGLDEDADNAEKGAGSSSTQDPVCNLHLHAGTCGRFAMHDRIDPLSLAPEADIAGSGDYRYTTGVFINRRCGHCKDW